MVTNNNVRLPLSFRTLPVTARHMDGSLQYNTHNLYGLSQAVATYKALRAFHRKRPFILTRWFEVPFRMTDGGNCDSSSDDGGGDVDGGGGAGDGG